jgi:hypothetical protein
MGKSSKFRSKTPAKEFPLRIASVSLSHFSPPSRMGRVSGYHWQKNSLKETAQQSLFPTVPAPAPKSRLRFLATLAQLRLLNCSSVFATLLCLLEQGAEPGWHLRASWFKAASAD